SYKDTLNLPKTDFPMAANLTQMEPRIREKWEKDRLYEKIQAARKGAPLWVLHDGPPYANGDVHVGTGQNKVLKDIVVKFRTMQGFASPYIPGWDCHGLPIEHKVVKDLGPKAREMSKAEIRKLCLEFARKYIDIQRRQFKSLGVLADWEKPYLTIDPQYELGIIEVFELLWKKGHIAKRSRPIHWCINDRTALAEAELEYKDLPSPAVYLAFEMTSRPNTDLLVWTTTPWTLPADVAVAAHPQLEYAICKFRGREAIVAPQRLEELRKKFEIGGQIGSITGRELENQKYKHPLYGHECPVVLAEYVTTTDGTGLVHTAPGHGAEDYETGLKYKLPVLSPVDEGGLFTAEAKGYTGQQVFKANPAIVEDLRKSGVLVHHEEISHRYACCWRCKQPVIFRATEQWFILIDHDNGRQRALEAIKKVRWVPAWGETRISSMVEGRPDWCVSRQRSWGVPIPAFYCARCKKLYFNQTSFDAIKALIAKGGADAWFTTDAKDILPKGTACECGSTDFTKESDIFDVWFESGASHRSVLMKRPELHFPTEMYLEGTDQHRGWFQVSLLASLLSNGQAPFKEVVTHGFLMDPDSKEKLSKSKAEQQKEKKKEDILIPADQIVSKIGAELLRLWISSIDFTDDIPVSWDILRERAEPYKKIRNTIRYFLGMVSDFDPLKDRVADLLDVDRWALAELSGLVKRVTQHYENYQFFRAYQELYQFCVVEMSSIYFDVTKDRLYTSGKSSRERRSGQTAMYDILVALVKMLAPMLCHTMEEVWGYLPAREADSVHLASWPAPAPAEKEARWEKIFKVRTEVQRELEKLRAAGTIGKSLEARLLLHAADPELLKALQSTDLPSIFIVSEVEFAAAPLGPESAEVKGLSLKAEKGTHPKCERCWNLRKDVGSHPAHPGLCGRCVAALQ
ncbi:MAG: isoleucine--tRNA ligase, partial [Planctomycetaceae bacterium]|nr:isoleucine--tRNA ligase [Planctomycetaceae bacterium]